MEELRQEQTGAFPAETAAGQVQAAPARVPAYDNEYDDEYARPAARTLSSPKSKVVAAVLAFFLGGLGIHRFYVGKIGTGILMIVTLGGLGIWSMIDFIVILCGKFRDSRGRYLDN